MEIETEKQEKERLQLQGGGEKEEEEEEEVEATTGTKCYPEVAEEADEEVYHQLLQSSELFMQKLRDFHSSFHTQFISPSIGGATLDLHRLFVEVTSRGGLNKVITDRKWEEVVSAFKFEMTSFKRSFLLRKYYLSLLFHFEQAYFFKKKAPAAAITDAANKITVIESSVGSTSTFNDTSNPVSNLPASLQLQPGASLVGVIDEKLDNGYVVSVNMGSDTLKGILYHFPDKPPPSWTPNISIPRRRKRKKSQLSLVEYATLKSVSQGREMSVNNVGHTWNQSAEPEKQFYQDKGIMAKEPDHTDVVNSAVNLISGHG